MNTGVQAVVHYTLKRNVKILFVLNRITGSSMKTASRFSAAALNRGYCFSHKDYSYPAVYCFFSKKT